MKRSSRSTKLRKNIRDKGKKLALGALVIAMGALGVAGGSKTIVLLKNWFQSLWGGSDS